MSGYVAFGDSVMLGAEADLRAAFPGITMDAVEGEQPYETLGRIASSKRAHLGGMVVFIHTGDNGLIPPDQLDSTLRSLGAAAKIVVLTDRVPRDWQDQNNAVLHQVVARYRNATLLDWYGDSADHAEWFYEDGIHLRPIGAIGYTALLDRAIGRRTISG